MSCYLLCSEYGFLEFISSLQGMVKDTVKSEAKARFEELKLLPWRVKKLPPRT